MKKVQRILCIVLLSALFIASASQEKIKFKLANEKNKIINHQISFVYWETSSAKNKIIWNFDLKPTKVVSGRITKAKIRHNKFDKYLSKKSVDNAEFKLSKSYFEKPESSKEFSKKNGFLDGLEKVLPEEIKAEKDLINLICSLCYVYLPTKTAKFNEILEPSKSTKTTFKSLLGISKKAEIILQSTIVKRFGEETSAYGISDSILINSEVLCENEESSIASAGHTVFSTKSNLIAGIKSHGWCKLKNISENKIKFEFEAKLDPPGGFAADNSLRLPRINSQNSPFGTVTPDEIIAGDLDCKGDTRKLVQGGYMRFDLSEQNADSLIRSAQLKVYVKKLVKNPWLWVCQISNDPFESEPKDIFEEIQAHKALISGAQKVRPEGWTTIQLNQRAVNAINDIIATKKDKWYALSLTFE